MELSEIAPKYLELKDKFEEALEVLLGDLEFNTKLPEIFNYSLINAGKRFRSVLALAVSEGLGQSSSEILPFCLAVELLHNSSLIHDDLPSLDNDSLRRGRDTVHIRYGEAQAILAADALISIAFNSLTKADVPPQIVVSWLRDLSNAFTNLCHGQSLDIEEMKGELGVKVGLEGKAHLEQQLQTRHMLKTGALIKASVMAPLSISGSPTQVNFLSAFSEHLGLLFQITDDIEDHLELEANQQSPDEATYVSLLGIDGARKRAFEVANMALDSLKSLSSENAFDTISLSQLTLALRNRA